MRLYKNTSSERFQLTRMHISSIRTRFLLGFVALSVMVSVIFLFYFYTFSQQQIVQRVGDVQTLRISSAMHNAEMQLSEVNSFFYWLITNKELEALLRLESPDDVPYSTYKQGFFNDLNNLHIYNQVKNRINLLYIRGTNGLTILYGKNAYNIETESVLQDEWYQQAKASNGSILWFPAIKNYSQIPLVGIIKPPADHVIPVFKYIKYGTSSHIFGEIILLLDSDIMIYIDDAGMEDALDMMVDPNGTVIAATDFDYVGKSLSDETFYKEAIKQERGTFSASVDGINSLVTISRPQRSGNSLISILAMSSVTPTVLTLVRSSILWALAIMIFSIIVSIYLSANFSRPIQAIIKRIDDISQGVFHQHPMNVTAWNVEEVRFLSARLDMMEYKLQHLIRERVVREQEKRDLEIQMLQSQISPHFLNNTISSIRMMATIQGAQSIERMLEGLSTILASTLKQSAEQITLRDELKVVDAYIYIQRIRYHGRINYELRLKNENLLNCLIVRFTLQPLIENAIFHGVVPKNEIGRIILSVRRDGENLSFIVADDGVGIPPEKVEGLLNGPKTNDRRILHGFGLANVNRRLKLVYGESYGLSIISTSGLTQIAVTIPFKISQREEADESTDR